MRAAALYAATAGIRGADRVVSKWSEGSGRAFRAVSSEGNADGITCFKLSLINEREHYEFKGIYF